MGKKEKGNKGDKGGGTNDDSRARIAIVTDDKCKPKKCRQECKRSCPVVHTGKLCIEVENSSKLAYISETLCIGCGICVKKCPFQAITIINIPSDLNAPITHRFGPNTFRLHRLPVPRAGKILGLVGTNGIGKTTALKILSGKLKPNLGRYTDPPPWTDILTSFRGSELQNFFKKMLNDGIKAVIKPQYVDLLPKQTSEGDSVWTLIHRRCDACLADRVMIDMELTHLSERTLVDLSGGELQRFAIALVLTREADIYMYDEPSSYLDVSQRIGAARTIRNSCVDDKYVIVVEHDLSVLDYLSDYICCLVGQTGAYGVVTTPFTVREGINIFLDGYVPTENLRFRRESLNFKISTEADKDMEEVKRLHYYTYPTLSKTLGQFSLFIHEGSFSESEITILLGKNGSGKSTFIKILAGLLKADNDESEDLPKLSVSYKPQIIQAKFQGTVRTLLHSKIRHAFIQPMFQTDVLKPMQIESLYDQEVQYLSGGELQRLALVMALGKPADIYLIDEPSAHLDSEQRIIASRVIKRFILHAKKTAFIVEHDFIMATYLADKIVVFQGEPGIQCTALYPETPPQGLNRFLKELEITFRKDPTNHRPRINQLDSVKDKEQKLAGTYYLLDDL